MTVTTTFTSQLLKSVTISADGSGGYLTSLPGGGFAATYTTADNNVYARMFDSAGNAVGASFPISNIGVTASNPAMAQLSDGNNVVVFQDNDSLVFEISSPGGDDILADIDMANTNTSNPDVAALTGGGFVIVGHDTINATESDIIVSVRFNHGPAVATFTIDGTAKNTNAKVAALADGGFAVAWQRESLGETELWSAIYNANGSVRKPPALLDTVGSINENADVVALANGGFGIVYEDNGWGGEREISFARYSSTGTYQGLTQITDNSQSEFQPSAVQLSNGVVAISYHDNLFGDTDPIVSFVDGNTGELLSPDGFRVSTDTGNEVKTSITALNDGKFVMSWHDGANNDVLAEIHQSVRLSTGDGADDVIVGYELVDEMHGGNGNDTLEGRAGADILDGGSGTDAASYNKAVSGVTASLSDATKNTGEAAGDMYVSIENLSGSAFADTLFGDAGDNVINGRQNADQMIGGAGNDRYYVDNSADVIVEKSNEGTADRVYTAANYSLKAGVGIETLSTTNAAGTTALKLAGNSYANTVVGNAGDNFINGAAGADTLTGGAGKDTFMFNTALGSPNVDTITDFNVADDTIRLENGIFTAIAGTGTLTAAQFVKNATGLAEDANDRIIYETDTGKLFYDANGSASGGRLHFATLEKNLGLTAGDFFIV
jgi:hypothetical protein